MAKNRHNGEAAPAIGGPINGDTPYRMEISFPGEPDYIPLVRKWFADVLLVLNFSPKFSFRSEFIVDELCNNAITYGCTGEQPTVDLMCVAYNDRVEFSVRDRGGYKENIRRFRDSPFARQSPGKADSLDLLRLLADAVTFTIDDNYVSHIHVVRKHEGSQ